MTATRDRRSDLDTEPRTSTWGDRPAFGSRALPWWGAVLLALALATVGALFDVLTSKTLGRVFQGGFVLGCVLAVVLVRRRSLFGPIVQPPLIMVLVAGPVLALFAGGSGGGVAAKAIAIGPPLIGNFPAMAIATVGTVVIGVIRLILQRRPKLEPYDDEDFPPPTRRTESPSARGSGRDRDSSPRQPAPRPAPGRRPASQSGRDRMERPERGGDRPDRERMERDRDRQPPPPPRQMPPGRGEAPGGRPIPGGGAGGGGRGTGERPAAPGRGGGMGGRPGAGGGRPPQPPPRRPRRPDEDY